jgi:predicted component of type VI protein secretion system
MRPRGRIESVGAAVGDAARALRRARGRREARVRLYDERGQALTLDPADERARAIAEEAAAMIDAVDARPGEAV